MCRKYIYISPLNTWVVSLLFVLLLIMLCVIFLPIQYETIDDTYFMEFTGGFKTGTPSAYALFPSIIFGFIVSRFYIIAPALPWYTIAHLFTMWLSASVICFCLFDGSLRKTQSVLVSLITVLCIFLPIFAPSFIVLQFTTTPAIAIGAAIVLLLHYERRSRRYFFFAAVLTTLLVCIAHSFRPETSYIGICLYICIALVRLIQREEQRKQTVKLIIFPITIFLLLHCINTLAYRTFEYIDYKEFQNELGTFIDYPRPLYEQAPEVYENAGFSMIDTYLITSWYLFIDEVNTENLRKLNNIIAEYYKENPRNKYESLFDRVMTYSRRILMTDEYNKYCFYIIFFSTGMIILSSSKKKAIKSKMSILIYFKQFTYRNGDKLIASGIITFFCLANVYFVHTGRFPNRVYLAIVHLSAYGLLYLSAKKIQDESMRICGRGFFYGVRKIAFIVAIIFSLLSCGAAVSTISISELEKRKDEYTLPLMLANDYALKHPGNLYFYDDFMVSLDAFAVYPNEKPTNNIWLRGPTLYLPAYYEQLSIHGINKISHDLLLDERAYFMTRILPDALVVYYKQVLPEYEFVLIDEISTEVLIYKLLPLGTNT